MFPNGWWNKRSILRPNRQRARGTRPCQMRSIFWTSGAKRTRTMDSKWFYGTVTQGCWSFVKLCPSKDWNHQLCARNLLTNDVTAVVSANRRSPEIFLNLLTSVVFRCVLPCLIPTWISIFHVRYLEEILASRNPWLLSVLFLLIKVIDCLKQSSMSEYLLFSIHYCFSFRHCLRYRIPHHCCTPGLADQIRDS